MFVIPTSAIRLCVSTSKKHCDITVLRDLTVRYIGVLPCFVPPLNHMILDFKINTSVNPLTFWHRSFTFKFQHIRYVKCE
jgi:hypothetical protein